MAKVTVFSGPASRYALAIFCRAPRLGTVKTRLAASYDEVFALELYRAMLADCFNLGLALAPRVDTFACFTPQDALTRGGLHELWEGRGFPQCEGDLGARMLDCLAQLGSQGYQRVAIIGSDSPDLPVEIIEDAFEKLNDHPVVVGPSEDGGFYLLGIARPLPGNVFEGIKWSSDQVYKRLTANLKKGMTDTRVATLPMWRDIDDNSDLFALEARLLRGETRAPQTKAFLERQQLRGSAGGSC